VDDLERVSRRHEDLPEQGIRVKGDRGEQLVKLVWREGPWLGNGASESRILRLHRVVRRDRCDRERDGDDPTDLERATPAMSLP
jgi:hypothetical protein